VVSIAIVGAGAKAAAIAARAAVLRDLGAKHVPEILVFEADHVGAAWSGESDFSSGFLTLCTPGEKDIGFPYNEWEILSDVTAPTGPALFSRFSWGAYLVSVGQMSNWVDRGRHHPSHKNWADYLHWVFKRSGQHVTIAKVTEIRPTEDRWKIVFQQNDQANEVFVDGVVLTGPGRAKEVPVEAGTPKNFILNAETFWRYRHSVLKLESGTIAVAGDGGAAGTIVAWLAEKFHENEQVFIQSISPMGTLFPRGDGHAERRWFSDPSDWPALNVPDRRTLIGRTEAGVVSMRIKSIIDQAYNIGYLAGKARVARWNADDEELEIDLTYHQGALPALRANYLINAIGFDSWSLLELVKHPKSAALRAADGGALRERVELQMQADLSLPAISGLPQGLHVPALGGLAHGPGMGNLGCLGLMAASVLKPYLRS